MFNTFHVDGVKAFDEYDYEIAKALFLQAIDKNPEVAESYLYLGKCYFFCDEKLKAISPLQKFIQSRKVSIDAVANVAYAFDLLGQCYEAVSIDTAALTCFDEAIQKNLSCASSWHNMGLLYMKSAGNHLEKNLKESAELLNGAQVYIHNALKICGDNPLFLHSAASWYEQYIEVLESAVEDEDSVQKNIARNFTFAIQYYRKALSACKDQDIVLKNIIISNLTECIAQYGHFLYRNGNYSEAQETYLQALQLDPDHLIVINQIGMALFKQNCFAESRKYFSSILEKTDEKKELADAWLNIACTFRLEKEWPRAEEALAQATGFNPDDTSIFDEEKKLLESKSAALLIATPQTLFSNANPDSHYSVLPASSEHRC